MTNSINMLSTKNVNVLVICANKMSKNLVFNFACLISTSLFFSSVLIFAIISKKRKSRNLERTKISKNKVCTNNEFFIVSYAIWIWWLIITILVQLCSLCWQIWQSSGKVCSFWRLISYEEIKLNNVECVLCCSIIVYLLVCLFVFCFHSLPRRYARSRHCIKNLWKDNTRPLTWNNLYVLCCINYCIQRQACVILRKHSPLLLTKGTKYTE